MYTLVQNTKNKLKMSQSINPPCLPRPPYLGKVFQMDFWRGGRTIPTTAASGDPVTSWKFPKVFKRVKDQGNIRVFPKIGAPLKWMVYNGQPI